MLDKFQFTNYYKNWELNFKLSSLIIFVILILCFIKPDLFWVCWSIMLLISSVFSNFLFGFELTSQIFNCLFSQKQAWQYCNDKHDYLYYSKTGKSNKTGKNIIYNTDDYNVKSKSQKCKNKFISHKASLFHVSFNNMV